MPLLPARLPPPLLGCRAFFYSVLHFQITALAALALSTFRGSGVTVVGVHHNNQQNPLLLIPVVSCIIKQLVPSFRFLC